MPNVHVHDSRARRHIAMLAFDGSEILDICGPLDAFYYADRWLRELGRVSEPVYPARILGPAAGPIVTSSGMRIMVDQAFCDVDVEIDTLLVAGGEIDAARNDPALLAWLKQTASSARRTASICTGAFRWQRVGFSMVAVRPLTGITVAGWRRISP